MLLAAPTDINIHICIYVCGCARRTAADSAGATAGADGLLALELLHEDNPSAACGQ